MDYSSCRTAESLCVVRHQGLTQTGNLLHTAAGHSHAWHRHGWQIHGKSTENPRKLAPKIRWKWTGFSIIFEIAKKNESAMKVAKHSLN
jgi:hypothetical protein